MTGTRVVVIVLVAIAILFVVFVAWGAGNNASGPRVTASNFDADHPPAIVAGLNQLLGSHGPSLDAAHLQPSATTFDLQKQASYSVAISADTDHAFRQAKFKVEPQGSACARVVFTGGSDAPDSVKKQDSRQAKNRNEFTLSIPKGGGSLMLGRESPFSTAPCTVKLQ